MFTCKWLEYLTGNGSCTDERCRICRENGNKARAIMKIMEPLFATREECRKNQNIEYLKAVCDLPRTRNMPDNRIKNKSTA
jgi:hypothetical protein